MHTLTMAATAKTLGISRPTLYKQINKGRLKTITIGRRRFTTPQWVDEYIESRLKAA